MPRYARYLVVNAHGRSNDQRTKFAKFCKELNPDYIICSEAIFMRTFLERAGYNVYGGMGKTRGKKDVAIFSKYRATFDGSVKLSPNLNRPIAPDRHMLWIRRWRRLIFSLHLNAAIQDSSGRWRKWRVARVSKKAMRKINRSLRLAQSNGLKPVGGGDLNWREWLKYSDVKYSPQWLAKKRNLGYVTSELMWLFWDKKHYELSTYRVIPKHLIPTGTKDKHPHPALMVDLILIPPGS